MRHERLNATLADSVGLKSRRLVQDENPEKVPWGKRTFEWRDSGGDITAKQASGAPVAGLPMPDGTPAIIRRGFYASLDHE